MPHRALLLPVVQPLLRAMRLGAHLGKGEVHAVAAWVLWAPAEAWGGVHRRLWGRGVGVAPPGGHVAAQARATRAAAHSCGVAPHSGLAALQAQGMHARA